MKQGTTGQVYYGTKFWKDMTQPKPSIIDRITTYWNSLDYRVMLVWVGAVIFSVLAAALIVLLTSPAYATEYCTPMTQWMCEQDCMWGAWVDGGVAISATCRPLGTGCPTLTCGEFQASCTCRVTWPGGFTMDRPPTRPGWPPIDPGPDYYPQGLSTTRELAPPDME